MDKQSKEHRATRDEQPQWKMWEQTREEGVYLLWGKGIHHVLRDGAGARPLVGRSLRKKEHVVVARKVEESAVGSSKGRCSDLH